VLFDHVDTTTVVCYFAGGNSKGRSVGMEAYCMKCKGKVEIQNPRSITMKNGRPATQGLCPRCGTKVFRIVKA